MTNQLPVLKTNAEMLKPNPCSTPIPISAFQLLPLYVNRLTGGKLAGKVF